MLSGSSSSTGDKINAKTKKNIFDENHKLITPLAKNNKAKTKKTKDKPQITDEEKKQHQREQWRKYYHKNKDKYKQWNKRWREKQKEKKQE